MIVHRYISILLIFAICFALLVCPVSAAEENSLLVGYEDNVIMHSITGGTTYSLYLDEDTPLTLKHFVDNPDLSITISIDSGGWFIYFANSSYKCYDQTMTFGSDFFSDYLSLDDDLLSLPLKYKMGSNGWYNGSFTCSNYLVVPDITEPSDPSEDDREHGGAGSGFDDDSKTFLESLLSGVLKPINDLVASISELMDTIESTWKNFDSLQELWEKLKPFIPKDERGQAAVSKIIYEIFDNMDADDWGSYDSEGGLFRTYAELNEPELLEDFE